MSNLTISNDCLSALFEALRYWLHEICEIGPNGKLLGIRVTSVVNVRSSAKFRSSFNLISMPNALKDAVNKIIGCILTRKSSYVEVAPCCTKNHRAMDVEFWLNTFHSDANMTDKIFRRHIASINKTLDHPEATNPLADCQIKPQLFITQEELNKALSQVAGNIDVVQEHDTTDEKFLNQRAPSLTDINSLDIEMQDNSILPTIEIQTHTETDGTLFDLLNANPNFITDVTKALKSLPSSSIK